MFMWSAPLILESIVDFPIEENGKSVNSDLTVGTGVPDCPLPTQCFMIGTSVIADSPEACPYEIIMQRGFLAHRKR